jgi:AraC-like DNA-binding protein
MSKSQNDVPDDEVRVLRAREVRSGSRHQRLGNGRALGRNANPGDASLAPYRELVLMLNDHAQSRNIRFRLEVDELYMLFYSIINCRTLGEVLNRVVAFVTMLQRPLRASLRVEHNFAEFSFEVVRGNGGFSSFATELIALSVCHQFFSWTIGENIRIDAAVLDFDPVITKDVAPSYMGLIPMQLSQTGSGNKLLFHSAYLARRVVRPYRELVELLKVFPEHPIPARYACGRNIGAQVRVMIFDALEARMTIPRIPELARRLNLSPATLCRRLTDEGTSIGEIKDACRRHLAEQYLSNGAMSITDVSDLLGYSDTNNFRRAFKGWNGMSPSDFAKRTIAASGSHDSTSTTVCSTWTKNGSY